MSRSITLNNIQYNGVQTVTLPASQGGVAKFRDEDDLVIHLGDNTNITVLNTASTISNYNQNHSNNVLVALKIY